MPHNFTIILIIIHVINNIKPVFSNDLCIRCISFVPTFGNGCSVLNSLVPMVLRHFLAASSVSNSIKANPLRSPVLGYFGKEM